MGEGQGSRRVCGGWRWGTSVLSAHRVGPCPLGTGSGSLLPEGVAASTCLWSWGPMPWTSLMLMVLARPPPGHLSSSCSAGALPLLGLNCGSNKCPSHRSLPQQLLERAAAPLAAPCPPTLGKGPAQVPSGPSPHPSLCETKNHSWAS